ncbi:phosphate ABC transporter permease subunit PstC [Rhodococcus opacus]|uniref:phosphate ABC transporter permease subunit PstC n=1 Tax=Rhodococcus opacus TaxID=37919 RepID=UPI0029C2252C|nr:phosphate ABC transporter permease subunit PstC [Rhodococcus opacus]MDX5962021.1 phosphate ABC transporter permease subunit PstC [Rhodococcus opacus]
MSFGPVTAGSAGAGSEDLTPTGSPADLRATSKRIGERIILAFLAGSALVSVAVTAAIVVALIIPLITFFQNVSVVEFLTGTTWTAGFGSKSDWTDKQWGVLPLVAGTLGTTVIALLVAVPFGLGAATYLAEYADERIRRIVKPILEILAGVPTVVYGVFALTIVTPLLQDWVGAQIFNTLSPGIVMGFMIVPTIASLSEDAMSAVPRDMREGSYAVGANRRQTTLRVVFPAALSGIVAAIVLGVSRAVGETMIVAIAAGSQPQFTLNPLVGAQTMTGFIAQVASGDAPQGSPVYYSLFAVGALLFLITLVMNIISITLVRRYRQAY